MHAAAVTANRRRFERFALPAAYTAVHVRRAGRKQFSLHGHAYDISAGGVRIELDKPLTEGEAVDLRVDLPGHRGAAPLEAAGRVVRYENAGQPGPTVMGIEFTAAVSLL